MYMQTLEMRLRANDNYTLHLNLTVCLIVMRAVLKREFSAFPKVLSFFSKSLHSIKPLSFKRVVVDVGC